MTRYRILLVLFIAIIASAGAAAIGKTGGSDAETILELEREWDRRFAAQDVDWIANAHAPDARQFQPNMPGAVGREAIRASFLKMFADGVLITWEPTEAFVSESGEMAWDRGVGTLTTPDGVAHDLQYVCVWQRIDGEWKIVQDMFGLTGD